MREILFRGKCPDTGRWYEGQYIHLHKTTFCFKEDYDRYPDNDIHQIVFEEMTDWGLPNRHLRADVIPETVGQFTGIIDKNGKRIYEGDMVIAYDIFGRKDDCGVVNWNDLFCAWHVGKNSMYGNRVATYEVIGNTYDGEDVNGD